MWKMWPSRFALALSTNRWPREDCCECKHGLGLSGEFGDFTSPPHPGLSNIIEFTLVIFLCLTTL